MKKIAIVIFAVALLVAYSSAFAAEKPKEKQTVKRSMLKRMVQGEVDGVGPDFISITYEADNTGGSSKAVLLPFDPHTVSIQNKRTLREIKVGDIVAVEYDEATEDGRMTRVATKMIFIKAAAKPMQFTTLDSGLYEPPEAPQAVETPQAAEPVNNEDADTDE
jgi:hypothetical protein